MAQIGGKPIIGHIFDRVRLVPEVRETILATSDQGSDDLLVEWAELYGAPVYRGSLNDVLDRFVKAASVARPEHVVRITGDCPFIDPSLLSELISVHCAEGNSHTALSGRFPDGLDCSISTMEALVAAQVQARRPSEREHVTLFLDNRPDLFRVGTLDCSDDLSHIRVTVDEPVDLDVVRGVYDHFSGSQAFFGFSEIQEALLVVPELFQRNKHIPRNQGLQESLRRDFVAGLAPQKGSDPYG